MSTCTTPEQNSALTAAPSTSAPSAQPRQFLRPPASITASEDGYFVTLDLPGVKRSDLEITFENGELTITGRRTPPVQGARLIHRESVPGDFRRAFELDATIDASRIAAKLEDGVLQLTLPKAESARPRRIEIVA